MIRVIKNRKGATLVTVVIVVTVLVILSSILLDAVLSNLVMTKRHMNIDFAYYAGESAIENWMSIIYSNIADEAASYTGSVEPTSEESRKDFATHIVNQIKSKYLLKDLWIDVSNKEDSLVSTSPINTSAKVEFLDLTVEKTSWDSSMKDSIDIYIGISSKSSFSLPNTPYNTGNKEVYAVKPFRVKFPTKSYLESAIWAVGDFYINGNEKGKTSVVKGDVYTFGSYAKDVNDMDQQLFGGIYALRGASLYIYGNAYSRSFVRTGPYATENDNSEIRVYKDIIAQCIQVFGDNDRIIGLRNAYTFDDIEVNGDNSFVAINGSYFGLTRGGENNNHDESSAIVNSALIHSLARHKSLPYDPVNKYCSDSFKSRIVINGDVILGGSTMKIDTDTNSVVGPIENASLAYNVPGEVPHYMLFDEWPDIYKYHRELRETADVIGYLNQFQVWSIVDPFNPIEINDWIKKINDERNAINNFGNYDFKDKDILTGWWEYEVVANNKVYSSFLSIINEYDSQYSSDLIVKKGDPKLGYYRLDNIYENGKIKYDKDTWKEVDDKIENENDDGSIEIISMKDYLFGVPDRSKIGKCERIKNDLENKVNRYISRTYSSTGWEVNNRIDEFHKILEALENKAIQAERNEEEKKHIMYLDKDFIDGIVDIKDLFSMDGYKIDIYDVCENNRDDEYYIIANANPNLHLQISGKFNGIIVTAGKVYLKDNANVYGSIIAAGNGEYFENKFYPKAESVTKGKSTNLDNGDFAAVIISNEEDDDDASAPYVDFYLGLAGDEHEYNKSGLLNVINHAIDEHGYFLPSDVDRDNEEEAILYLNRAARVNLLEKFLNDEWSIYLYDIF